MSSKFVRESVTNYLNANSAETFIDISGEFREILDLVADNGLTVDDNWIGVQYVANSEEPISIINGCYREFGLVALHVVAPIGLNVINSNILDRYETLAALFRGKRINDDIVIESITPLNTERGTTLEFDNGFTSGTFFVNYYRDLKGV